MEHTTITIGRQFGSRGRQIAKELAKRLGFSYYDKELLLKASKESGLSAAFLETMDERQASPFFYSLLSGPTSFLWQDQTISTEFLAYQAQRDTILHLAENEDCVIVGRCADYILKDKKKLVRIFICADEHDRIRHVMERDGIREKKAKKKIKEIEEQISNLNLFWLEEQRRNIGYLREEIDSLRSQHKNTVERQGQLKEQIRQLEYERLPALYQELSSLEDALNEEFSQEYQEKVGIPRYEQELYRLKRAAVIQKNFSDQLIRTKNEMGLAERNLFQARREYADRFKPCPFRVDAADNEEYEAEQRTLEESELPKYREKIKAARESALEQFQNDFLSKLKSSIDQVQEQVKNLNKALKQAKFGTDQYQFKAERNPDYADYYDMIMAPELMEGEGGLFALPFQQKYGKLIETMFSQIAMSDDTQANSRKQSELLQNIERFTDFRTYLKFDLETTDQNGSKQLLSQTLNTKSGGETQTPFYIAVLASFAQLYQVNNPSILASNTMRLVVFDEAFNKMDSDRIIESVRLLRKMGLQAIICTPPDKLPDIMPLADRTHLVIKEKYQMHTKAWGKEILPA